ncbi:hypothetical protein [Gemmatimonas sp.]|uniref:hypothetical protein n=1 Tax=Gemmatimonas sp. TaxID=1962908 RepID=UPI003562448D
MTCFLLDSSFRAGALAFAGVLTTGTWTRTLHAQRERITVRVEALGGTDVSLPVGTTARDAFAQQAVQASLGHRFVRDQGNTIVVVGGQFRAVRAALPRERARLQGSTTFDAFTTLNVVAADLLVLRTVGTKHTMVGVLRPGLYGETFRVEGAAFVDRIVSARTTIGAGLSYASSFGKLLPIPVLHVVSRPSRRVLIDALLPSRGDVWWMPRKGLDLGINASLIGANYGLPDAQRVAGGDALWLANATVGPQVRWAPGGGKLQLTADAGMTVLRRLEYARDGRSVADLAPGNVPFVRLGAQRLF